MYSHLQSYESVCVNPSAVVTSLLQIYLASTGKAKYEIEKLLGVPSLLRDLKAAKIKLHAREKKVWQNFPKYTKRRLIEDLFELKEKGVSFNTTPRVIL
jgi:hypothetical protein